MKAKRDQQLLDMEYKTNLKSQKALQTLDLNFQKQLEEKRRIQDQKNRISSKNLQKLRERQNEEVDHLRKKLDDKGLVYERVKHATSVQHAPSKIDLYKVRLEQNRQDIANRQQEKLQVLEVREQKKEMIAQTKQRQQEIIRKALADQRVKEKKLLDQMAKQNK